MGGSGGTPLLGLCGYVPLNSVWFSRSWVYDFTIKRLEQGVFLNWKPSKSVKTCEERPTFAIPIIFFLNIYFSAKNYLILYAKQSKSGSESSVSCHGLKQGSEMRSFCLKQGRGLLASAAHLYTNLPWVFPPPPRPGFLTSHADVRSIRSSSRVLQMKVILQTIRQEIYSNMAKTPAAEGIWMQSSVTNICLVTFLLCECARLKCVHWKIQPLGWILRNRSLKIWLRGLGNKAKEMYYSLLSLKTISFLLLFPQASQLSMNFNISELVYLLNYFLKTHK